MLSRPFLDEKLSNFARKSHWSYIIPVGSYTSVGTFPGTTQSDRNPLRADWTLRHWRSRGAISAVYERKMMIFCVSVHFCHRSWATTSFGQKRILKYIETRFWAYFGPFFTSWRLIFTHPTSHWSYIIPVGPYTYVGTFPWDDNPFQGSLRGYQPLTEMHVAPSGWPRKCPKNADASPQKWPT